MKTSQVGGSALVTAAIVGGSVLGCQGSDAPKAWNALSTCLAGPGAGSPLPERVQKLRAAQLASVGTTGKDAWPARCVTHAEALYAASKDMPLMNRALKEHVGCRDEGSKCSLIADDAFLPTAAALWDAAQAAKLKTEPAPEVPVPALVPPPLADATSWKSFSTKPARVVGPALNADGSAVLLLAAREGAGKPRVCRLAAGLSELRCSDAHAGVPDLPAQSIALARDSRGPFVAGLTDAGLRAFNLETGAPSDVRGMGGNLVSDGVAIEPVAEAPPDPNAPAAPPDPKPKGFVAVELTGGKASRESKLAIEPVGTPFTNGDQIVYVTGQAGSATLEARSLSRGRLANVASVKGAFVGAVHSCTYGSNLVVATFAGREGQHNAKPTGGEGKTQLALAFRTGESWSKAQEATLPFDRKVDSDLVCTKAGASIAWIRPTADALEVGRVDCTPGGCKTNVEKLSSIESKWWGGVAPLGDKVLLLWRGGLGETRFRIGGLSELAQAPDQLLFDSADFGGPVGGEPTQRTTESAALFVFNQESPVALRIGADGRAMVL